MGKAALINAPDTDEILILTTGGTIDKDYFDALSEYRIGEPVIEQLLAGARVSHPFRIVPLLRKDSLDLDEDDRNLIAATIKGSTQSRVIVTHGTDTMTVTAEALTPIAGKAIILVGALAPARFAESDAKFNLGMAFAAAQLAPPGVYIAMNGTVFPAREVMKDRARGSFVRRS